MEKVIFETIWDIYIANNTHSELFNENSNSVRFYFLGNDQNLFEHVFYPLIENLEEGQLKSFADGLSGEQREVLLTLPENLFRLKIIEVLSITESDDVWEYRCYERVVKSYKHQQFFELLAFISIDKTYSLDKENHGFGYHFHIYEKTQRTATLLTFDPNEAPSKVTDEKYTEFDHSIYYEPHSEGSTNKPFQNINTKSSSYRNAVSQACTKVVLKTNKADFKKPSATKSIKLIKN